ncbi:MEKHLA domain-containing protein [Aliamphritea spongicola]|uniref:MEKHLA domain-containing protein n=1 Tax=Aliamphritea spongicola TaxID=707589 RepID=UPI00196B7E19|nr:MEKHLA domain-containing protein [Aliamphritea spongicola]MBN3560905.1 MEKHLA domain-containing protein [Aliamphritea spongicola]
MSAPDTLHTLQSPEMLRHLDNVTASYARFFNEPLISELTEENASIAEQLWRADFVLLSHGGGADPVFNFGNRMALELFEMDYAALTALPSRKSAEPVSQEERNHLLAQVTEFGCIDHYRGVRISATGKRFYIENARVWNLYDPEGIYTGQAAMFREWTPLEDQPA